ncbi:MAG: hypothetical protein ABSG16_23645 [Candidatus Acidiferrum sp.]|jgi:hypothetical protein
MPRDEARRESSRNDIDKVSSEACTRSGAFALLVSLVILLLCPYWEGRKSDAALASYLTNRLNLAVSLESLQNDAVWMEYAQSHPKVDQETLNSLVDTTVEIRRTASTKTSPPSDKSAPEATKPQKPNSPGSKPLPPNGLSATSVDEIEPPELSRIAEAWKNLNDSEMLTKSRENSNYFDFSIVKWVNRRGLLLYANDLSGLCSESEIEKPRGSSKSGQYVPQLNDNAVMNCATLSNLEDLAKFEMPQMSIPTDLGNRVSRTVDLTFGSLPKEGYAATLVAEALLFFVMVYFAAFVREAASSEFFPAPGTLFSGFSRSRWMLIVFLITLWTPLISVCAVTYVSRNLLVAFGIPLVLLGTYSVQRTLVKKSYFRAISPFLLRPVEKKQKHEK